MSCGCNVGYNMTPFGDEACARCGSALSNEEIYDLNNATKPESKLVPVQQYLLFTGDNFYPIGGWSDYHSSHDSIESAKLALGQLNASVFSRFWDWYHIVDLTTMEIVKKGINEEEAEELSKTDDGKCTD